MSRFIPVYPAIETRFLGPTNSRDSRVVATRYRGQRIILSWDHMLSPLENHRAAAKALANKLGWVGSLTTGETPSYFVHLFKHNRNPKRRTPK